MACPGFVKAPDRIRRAEVVVMRQTVPDELVHIQKLWPAFEARFGVRGRIAWAATAERTSMNTRQASLG
jgi:hypothetical protein